MTVDSSPRSVLVVTESSPVFERVGAALRTKGLAVSRAESAARARELVDRRPFDLIVADAAVSLGRDGLLTRRELPTELPIVVVGPSMPLTNVVDAMKNGAIDFVADAEPSDLLVAIDKALASVERAAEQATSLDVGDAMIGDSPAMQQVVDIAKRSSVGSATVLIRGETGTGKEIAARTIHRLSSRRDGPFIKVHCAALPDALLESELFGYEKGAFTGAAARKPGRVELAQGGTLFLDEIGDVTPAVQIKLLRVLQDREFERLGGTETLRTDARFCAATHRDLEGMIQRGEFREDLFYRLNVVPLWIPPLRARRPDIDALTRAFCARFGSAHGKPGVTFDDDAMRALRRERWPGNVRQLQNFVERLVVLTASSVITLRDVTDELSRQVRFVTQAPSSIVAPQAAVTPDDGSLEEQVRHAEREALKRALDRAKGNRTVAARILGINRRTLYNKIVEYELGDENQDE